jgi:hypothetical protein
MHSSGYTTVTVATDGSALASHAKPRPGLLEIHSLSLSIDTPDEASLEAIEIAPVFVPRGGSAVSRNEPTTVMRKLGTEQA